MYKLIKPSEQAKAMKDYYPTADASQV